MTADDAWIVQVSVRDEGSVAYVFFDSFATRAPWSGCGPLNSQLQQLQSQALQFNASCNDSSQRLRFNTSLSYREDLDVPAWLEQHRKSRYDASQRIGSLSVVKP